MRAPKRTDSLPSNNELNNESNNDDRAGFVGFVVSPGGSRGETTKTPTDETTNETTNEQRTSLDRSTITAWLDAIGETDQEERDRIGRIALREPAVAEMIRAAMEGRPRAVMSFEAVPDWGAIEQPSVTSVRAGKARR